MAIGSPAVRGAALLLLLLACKPSAPGAADAGRGTLRGHVRLVGNAPVAKPIDRHSDPFCEATPRFDESVVVDAQGGLRDALVHLALADPAAARGAAPSAAALSSAPALLEQRACTYEPRMSAIVEGQPLFVKNLDGTLHNVHVFRGTQTLLNRAQKIGSEPVGREIPGPPGMLEVKCDVHPWMEAHVYVSSNPWFAITGSDGAFEIRGAPAGKQSIELWHPVYGQRTAEIDIPAGGVATLELAFDASAAQDAGSAAPADPR